MRSQRVGMFHILQGAKLWQINVMTEGGHGPLASPCYREPWQRTFFVSLTLDHYIIFTAGIQSRQLTLPHQKHKLQLSQVTRSTRGRQS